MSELILLCIFLSNIAILAVLCVVVRDRRTMHRDVMKELSRLPGERKPPRRGIPRPAEVVHIYGRMVDQ